LSEKKTNEEKLKEEVPTSSKLAFGGISFTTNIFSGLVIATSFTYFYNVKLGLDEFWTGLAWLIFIAWNMINDPLIGFIEDRTKSEKYGRRVPYIRFGAPIFSGLFILSWFPIFAWSELALFFNLLFMLYTFDTLFTIIGLISFSLPAEMAITSEARSRLMIFGAVGSSLSFLLSFVLPAMLLTGDKPLELDPMIPVFRIVMIILGIIGGIILFISSYYIKENKYAMMEEPLSYKDSLIETLKNKPFLIRIGSGFSFNIGQFILTNGVLYYVDYILDLSGIMSMIPLLLFFIMVFLFFPLYSKFVRIYGLKNTFIFCLLFTSAAFIIGFFIGWEFYPALIAFIIMGAGISGVFFITQLLTADIIDYDEILTGKRRETSYAGMGALLTKPTNSIAPWLFLTVINAFGFNNDVQNQTTMAKFGIMLGFTLIPAILILISALIMYFFPLSGSKWKKQKKELHKIHQEKQQKYLNYLKEKGKGINI